MNWVIVVCSVITPGRREFNSDRCYRPWVNVSTNESERKRPANHKESHFTTQRARGTFRTLTVVQCDQTSFLTTSMMLLSKEARRPLQRPVQLPLTNEVQHGNRIDCSRSAVFAWWRRLGILSLARLARIIREIEDARRLFCYKHVVKTVFVLQERLPACLTIARHSVCYSPTFSTSLPYCSSTNGWAVPMAGRFC